MDAVSSVAGPLRVALALVLAAAPCGAAAPAGQRVVAVLDLEAVNSEAVDAAAVTQLVRAAIVESGDFAVVDKANMDKVLAEQAFQQTGCVSNECAVKLGKLLNVEAIVMGSLTRYAAGYLLNVQVVHVETGRILTSRIERMADLSAVDRAAARIAARLAELPRPPVTGDVRPMPAASAVAPAAIRPLIGEPDPPPPALEPARRATPWKWIAVGGVLTAVFVGVVVAR